MEAISVSKLKTHLSTFLSKVKGGEEVVVTERGRPVARLVPYPAGLDPTGSQARLVREGVLRPGDGRIPQGVLERGPRARSGASVVEALLEERAQGR